MNALPALEANPRLSRWTEYLFAAVFYTFLTLLYFFKTLPQFSTALIGPAEDNLFFYWALWYGTEALFRPEWSFFHSTMIYFPEGVNLHWANYFYMGIAQTLLLRPFLSLIASYNLIVMLTFVFSGLTTFFVLRRWTGHFVTALIGGFIFAFNPHHLAQALHHPTIASIQFIPLFVWCVRELAHAPRVRYAIGAAVFLVLNALCDWTYLSYGLLFLLFCIFYLTLRSVRTPKFKEIGLMLLSGMAALILLLPLILPMVSDMPAGSFEINNRMDIFAIDLLGFLAPPPSHLLAGTPILAMLNAKVLSGRWESVGYLGLANACLVLIALPLLIKEKRNVFLMLGVLMILSLGTTLRIGGVAQTLWMPYSLVQQIPLFENARVPGRLMPFIYFFAALLTSCALKEIFFKKRNPLWKYALLGFTCTFILVDFYASAEDTTPIHLPPSYRTIQNDPDGDFAILNVPWQMAIYMGDQTLHGRPDVQGYIGRKTQSTLIDRTNVGLDRLEWQKNLLRSQKVKYLLLHKKRRVSGFTHEQNLQFSKYMQFLIGAYQKVYDKIDEDETAAVFKVY